MPYIIAPLKPPENLIADRSLQTLGEIHKHIAAPEFTMVGLATALGRHIKAVLRSEIECLIENSYLEHVSKVSPRMRLTKKGREYESPKNVTDDEEQGANDSTAAHVTVG